MGNHTCPASLLEERDVPVRPALTAGGVTPECCSSGAPADYLRPLADRSVPQREEPRWSRTDPPERA
jgi:hypothetical protein